MQEPAQTEADFCIELDEAPSVARADITALQLICDENGLIENAPPELERRGTSSHGELWSKATIHKLSIVSKLESLGRFDHSEPLKKCHTVDTCRVCNGCKRVTVFWNRCERHYCPECAPRLAKERRESVEWWAREIREPKHVVVTTRNTDTLTKAKVQWFKQCLSKLRRRKFARNWKGGFYRLEVTNEGQGWHLHCHMLVDAGWVDAKKLSAEWAEVVGQDFAIVKVKDVHDRSYLAEVTKYTVKGSQLAAWSPDDIVTFLDAFQGVKTFGVFGSLYGKRTEWREWIDAIQARGPVCACGCENFRIMSANEQAWHQLTTEADAGSSRGLAPPAQADLVDLPPVEGRPAEHWKYE
jgi:hypothetical protein